MAINIKTIFSGSLLLTLVLSLFFFSGCSQTEKEDSNLNVPEEEIKATDAQVIETPVGFGQVHAFSDNWDSDSEKDGYSVWFTLKNSEEKEISAYGEIFFVIIKDGSEIRRTNKIMIKPEDFKKAMYWAGTKEKEAYAYSTKFETDKVDNEIYSVVVHFISIEGKEYSMEETRNYI